MRLNFRAVVAKLADAPRWLVGVIIVALFAVPPILEIPRAAFLDKLEAIAYDIRLKLTQSRETDPQVVIIDIDERTMQREGRFPWSRYKMALLTAQLFEHFHVRALGFDILFSEPDNSGGMGALEELADDLLKNDRAYRAALEYLRPRLDYDKQFAGALASAPTVLAFSFTPEPQEVGVLPAPLFTTRDLGGNRIPIDSQAGYVSNLAVLERAATDAGHIDPLFDPDNVMRKAPLLKEYKGAYYGTLSLALARIAVDAKKIVPHFDSNHDLDALDVGGLVLPVSKEGNALVPYRGPKQQFRYISATDVLDGTAPQELLEGTIAIVGTSAKGLADLRATPMGPDFPGVEIHANLLSGMLNGDLKSVPAGVSQTEGFIMLIAGALAIFAVPWRRPVLSLVGIIVVTALVVTLNLWFWQKQAAVLPIAATLAMMLILLLHNLLTGFLRESRAIQQLSAMFGEYVPPERVAQMRESGERFTLEGESREMTVLFSDVRDFTALSESLPPQELSAMMGAYLTALTEVIHASHGTVDKYIGDAVMAFWGAPLESATHARDGVATALAMQERMRGVRVEFRDRGWPEFHIGVGLNTGPMNVGDMGSRFRKAYTVLGDAVNLASRLEALTKLYGVPILVGDATRRAAPEFSYREIDRVRVKGRAQALTIYEPLGAALDDAGRARLARWHEALALYRAREFASAAKMFAAFAAEAPGVRLYTLFQERSEAYVEAILPTDWDGAANYATK